MPIPDMEDSGFEERADFISDEDILKWNVDTEYFEDIQKRLIERGAKVIVGPRGTGKTHQMKIAYYSCVKDSSKPFAAYISFSKYYHLEPLLSKNPAAIIVFHTWVLCKILLGCDDANYLLKNTKSSTFCNDITRDKLEKFISQSEKNIQEAWHDEIINNITIEYVLDYISKCMFQCKRKRAILLLDDAALTLTKDYMIEFFDIFRSLKTINISPKASVYPGTTEYGPRFHLKQDADPFNVWFNPESTDYKHFIDQLCLKRFNEISIDENIKELLRYASFGNPRAFITLLRDFEESHGNNQQVKFNNIIDIRSELLKDEYISIKQKLTQYSTIIDTGWDFFEAIINDVTAVNRKLISESQDEKQIIIGLLDFSDTSIERMLKFLIEAGLLFELPPVKHGESREYRRYIPHLIFLFQKRAFIKSRGFNSSEILDYLNRKNVKHPIRKDNIYNILDNDVLKNLKLDLPSCSKCGAPRLTENQKFCHVCGAELISKSSFEKCMKLTIDDLPITQWQKDKIKSETDLKTIRDFLSVSDIGDELRKPHGIGRKRAEKIIDIVNNLIEEFLA